jgi:hypothetical protein
MAVEIAAVFCQMNQDIGVSFYLSFVHLGDRQIVLSSARKSEAIYDLIINSIPFMFGFRNGRAILIIAGRFDRKEHLC